jgi:hypothetical protein
MMDLMTSLNFKTMLAPSSLLALLAGCGTMGGFGLVDSEHGARLGEVMAIYTAQTPAAMRWRCIAALSPDQVAGHRYLEIRYHHGRLMRHEVAEFASPDGQAVSVGDFVELYPADCDKGDLSRITHLVPPRTP